MFLMGTEALDWRGRAVRLVSRRDRQVQLLVLVVGLAVAVSVWVLRDHIESLDVVGYPGVFLLSFLGSVSMVLPVPGLISVCATAVVLSPFVLGVLSGVGETLGEVSGYGVGYGGHSFVERHRFYNRLKGWMERRGSLVLFIVSAVPNPAFDLVGIAAGSVRFPLRKFLIMVLAGKLVKGLLVAYTCYFGVRVLPWVE